MDKVSRYPSKTERREMPPYLFDEQGLRYKLHRAIHQYYSNEQEYTTVGIYAHDGSKIEWDGEPQPDTRYQIKSPPWVEGLRMIKAGEKQWREQRRAKSGGQG